MEIIRERLKDDRFGTIILEASGANYGSVPFPPGFLEGRADAGNRSQARYIVFDEIITGFRWSPGGLQSRDGIVPDLTALAKILTGGLPGGAVAGRADIMALLDPGERRKGFSPPVSHKGTFNASHLVARRERWQPSSISKPGNRKRQQTPWPRNCAPGFGRFYRIYPSRGPCTGRAPPSTSILESATGPFGRFPLNAFAECLRKVVGAVRNALLADGVELMSYLSGVTSAAHDNPLIEEALDIYETTFRELKRAGVIGKNAKGSVGMIHARAAIIGGGIMGASALYHLVRNGWTDSVLLEKAELTSGSTWHAAGQITHAVGSHVMGWINKTSIACYKEAEAKSGQSVGWHECGGLRVARDADELDWLKSMLGIGNDLNLSMELVDPDVMTKLHPYYETDGIIAALHTPFDGHVDPSGATFALAAAARSSGGTVIRRNRVLGAERRGSEWLLQTEQEDVIAEHVVIAAGAYANQVGEWFGLEIPSVNCLHHYFVTEPVPEFADLDAELPVIRDNSIEGYVRQEQNSALIGVFENANAPTAWDDGGPWDAENPLFEADYERVGDFLELAVSRMPVLANLGIRRAVRGILSHTPDGGMLVGPSGIRNVWLACGSSIGLAWGGGSGRLLADWMVHGSTEVSTRSLDPRRYGDYADRTYVIVKSKEDFEIRHQTPVPGFQRPAGRPWRKHPPLRKACRKGSCLRRGCGMGAPAMVRGISRR